MATNKDVMQTKIPLVLVLLKMCKFTEWRRPIELIVWEVTS